MSFTQRIQRNSIRLRDLFKDKTGHSGAEHAKSKMLFRRSPGEQYTFEEGHILLNGNDILAAIEGPNADVESLVILAAALDEYRRTAWVDYGTEHRHFNGQLQGLLEKIMGKLNNAYEEMSGGLKVQLQAGQLWINDIDPDVVLSMFLSHPTEERKRYLKSLQSKLALILEGKVVKSHSHALLQEVERVFTRITKALQNAASSDSPILLAAHSAVGR